MKKPALKINWKKLLLGSVIIIMAILIFFFFYEFGFMKYFQLRRENKVLQEHVAEIEKKNQKMKAEIDSLKFNDAKIEKVAREKYNMTRKGENAFRIEIK